LCRGCCSRTDLLFGFRYVGLADNLQIGEALTVLPAATGVTQVVPVGTTFQVSDRFHTSNRFYGGHVGLDTEYRRGRWFLDLKGKVALGSNHEVVNIGGNTIVTAPGAAPVNLTGGLLALSSNIGRFSRDMFVVAPEATINLGYQVTPAMRVFVGYNFLYLSNVVRAGNQIDPIVNPNLIPSTTGTTPSLPVRPAFAFKGTDFWAQGVNFGLEFRY
ncbi:MAG TPA: BBP7 family outer membrane beta-barrel protein, partial [Gemmataceae bacterium]